MTPAHLALAAAAALLVCARADFIRQYYENSTTDYNGRHFRLQEEVKLPAGCLYDGRWHDEGTPVAMREDCLRCICLHGALLCRRRACTALPDPLPRRCHVRHRRDACCPELHCSDVTKAPQPHGIVARFESVSRDEINFPEKPPKSNACVEGGTVYAAGSALSSPVACEQCFCLRGTRRCVRPRCLPPPPHCAPRPAPGACCPQRYYCDDTLNGTSHHTANKRANDCQVNGKLVSEGEAVASSTNCSACYCLRGVVHCQPMQCAPQLLGCRPLRAPGQCCAHQYVCDHDATSTLLLEECCYNDWTPPTKGIVEKLHVDVGVQALARHLAYVAGYPSPGIPVPENSLESTANSVHGFHLSKSTKLESTTPEIQNNAYTLIQTPIVSNAHITTSKVKRKTDEPLLSSGQKQEHNNIYNTSTNIITTQSPAITAKMTVMPQETPSTDAMVERTTEQPEGTVKVSINGTINCTAELSSSSLTLNIALNDTDKIQMEGIPRNPIVKTEAHTYSPNDIITDRNVNAGFDENDTFTINVTSSLMANTSRSTSKPVMSLSKIPTPSNIVDALNSSKKTKGDYDYDYAEPTLPPSLPNLKIIPFVAADAVVDNEPDIKVYPILEREDKFPVYYPSEDSKNTASEDTYDPTQYPVFVSEKMDLSYSGIAPESGGRFPVPNEFKVQGLHETTTNVMENLFSPPIKTEGGFVPKGPGIIHEYAVPYPTVPVPHRTTSMQLDIFKGECKTEDGRYVGQGLSVTVGCTECTCVWGELRCAPRMCLSVAGCRRLPLASGAADCCGQLVCEKDDTLPMVPSTTPNPVNRENHMNEIEEVSVKNNTSLASQNITFSNENTTTTNKPKINDVTTEKATNGNTYINDVTKPPKTNTASVQNTTTHAPSTTTNLMTKLTTTVSPESSKETNDTSQEYEDDDDVGFSFGSVLKLLLSDSYETTTVVSNKKPSTKPPTKPTSLPPGLSPTPSAIASFIPFANRPPQNPLRKSPSTVNRIDHLVLGEATAIKQTTPRPITNKTKRPVEKTTTERRSEVKVVDVPFSSTVHEAWPPNLGGISGVSPGLLKLAGCNIYGRMYRVGRIIAELSTPCQECWCTEVGVQCEQLC